MPKLNCDVRNCSNNKEDFCTLAAIKIDGEGATNALQTCCEKFTGSAYVASNEVHKIQQSVNIECTAAGCIHNQQARCAAVDVRVSGANTATCSHDTECTSFWCR